MVFLSSYDQYATEEFQHSIPVCNIHSHMKDLLEANIRSHTHTHTHNRMHSSSRSAHATRIVNIEDKLATGK